LQRRDEQRPHGGTGQHVTTPELHYKSASTRLFQLALGEYFLRVPY
jgi:hypothetical protein